MLLHLLHRFSLVTSSYVVFVLLRLRCLHVGTRWRYFSLVTSLLFASCHILDVVLLHLLALVLSYYVFLHHFSLVTSSYCILVLSCYIFEVVFISFHLHTWFLSLHLCCSHVVTHWHLILFYLLTSSLSCYMFYITCIILRVGCLVLSVMRDMHWWVHQRTVFSVCYCSIHLGWIGLDVGKEVWNENRRNRKNRCLC